MRKTGYYWVKMGTGEPPTPYWVWEVMRYISPFKVGKSDCGDFWKRGGDVGFYMDCHFLEIREERLNEPF